MAYLLTFLEGITTFVSPCLLPMLPLYLAYFAGGGDDGAGTSVRHTLTCVLCFVAGFSVVFVALGAFAGSLGSLLTAHRRALDLACGAVVTVLGLNYLGVLHISALERGLGARRTHAPRTPLSSLAFGLVFAVSWTPCVGTFLASALGLAASSVGVAHGVALLLCYSAGLGLPLLLSALLIGQLEGGFAWIKAHYGLVNRVSGALLVVVGVLMASGHLGAWLGLLA